MLAWKDLAWWELEKSKPRRERHTHVKFNPLADPERQVWWQLQGWGGRNGRGISSPGGRWGDSLWSALMYPGPQGNREPCQPHTEQQRGGTETCTSE